MVSTSKFMSGETSPFVSKNQNPQCSPWCRKLSKTCNIFWRVKPVTNLVKINHGQYKFYITRCIKQFFLAGYPDIYGTNWLLSLVTNLDSRKSLENFSSISYPKFWIWSYSLFCRKIDSAVALTNIQNKLCIVQNFNLFEGKHCWDTEVFVSNRKIW